MICQTFIYDFFKSFHYLKNMNIIIRLACFFIFSLCSITVIGQTRADDYQDTTETEDDYYLDWNEVSFTERLVVGGSILPAYANGWYLDVSPIIGYRLTNSTIFGVGLTYSYRNIRDRYSNISKRIINTFGGNAFVMQYLLPNVFGQVEVDYSFLRYHELDPFDNLIYEEFARAPGFLIGGGYKEGNDYFSYNVTIMYDLLLNVNSTRNSPWVFRGGILISLY